MSTLAYRVATVFVTKKVDDAIRALNVDPSMQKMVKEAIYEVSPEFTLGDDGIDCDSEILDISFSEVSNSKVSATFTTQQDYTNSYGCMSWPVQCQVTIEKDDQQKYQLLGSCN